MSLKVVVGAGPTGTAVARLLASSGERVRLVSRRGTAPNHPLIEAVASDATDAERLTDLTQGASALFNCAMPSYDRWPTDWPPLAEALLTAVEKTNADYIMLSNTYGYGRVSGPIPETQPIAPTTVKGRVRAQMWLDALTRVRVTEVRAGQYLGAGAASLYALAVAPLVLAGQPVSYPGNLDVAHSWSYTEDVARTLVAASEHDNAFGQAWHVPSTSDMSVRQLSERLADLAEAPAPNLTTMPDEEFERLCQTDSIMAETAEMRYLTDEPHVLDSTRTERELGVKPTPLDEVLTETIRTTSTPQP
ncbi:NAD-dependent epimerase [Kibdelosporangium phytohabitans]|uniref:NAD-dependent epimerase n=2 Tax=Kibdelosporangium phytohabitans TaxID=860235 RepID=A0A0N7F2S9_9PSEU|nr:NAD-dependent epimerase/dehydratase family protein [Kibdelosporangium phytohabitans]ALG06679.1 NAD-dependent epimerase [Kibdelosporangium phytohabitans]